MKPYLVKIFWKRVADRGEGGQPHEGVEAVLNEAYEQGYRVYDTTATATSGAEEGEFTLIVVMKHKEA